MSRSGRRRHSCEQDTGLLPVGYEHRVEQAHYGEWDAHDVVAEGSQQLAADDSEGAAGEGFDVVVGEGDVGGADDDAARGAYLVDRRWNSAP
ncbi:hypothetical protein PUR49_15465 [Streptomyces sp. BE147]|uniref:hypothetical protein n=1 Tax=Streptomyces sp. BE147 TaxID=3002524 RepID=UPI002E7A2162|nr:hypothetical protein [Streptomyces sp. BE147]MEE1737888.1 hypothetical protein [Streptomyces sp. BE147]